MSLTNLTKLAEGLKEKFQKNLNDLNDSFSDAISEQAEDVARIEAMFGGRALSYLTQEEYDALPEEEKEREDIIYHIIDSVPYYEEIILQSPNGSLFKITIDDDGTIVTTSI